jgi:hypothetical protein
MSHTGFESVVGFKAAAGGGECWLIANVKVPFPLVSNDATLALHNYAA